MARWNPSDEDASIPREVCTGILRIGEYILPCAVLSNGQRVLSERGVTKALGGKRGGAHWRRLKESPGAEYRPVFLSANNLAPYTSESLRVALSQPVEYRSKHGRGGNGVLAGLLPEICDVLLKAREDGALVRGQEHIAAAAEVLVRGLAQVGIIALVDEATGYQEIRERDELQRILEAYISKELLPWTLRFPSEFYKELFRLRAWDWNPMSTKRPKRVGKDTEYIVYDRLPPGVKEELRAKNPNIRPGYRRHKHFQFLTTDIGNPHLERLVAVATALMRVSSSWGRFTRLLERAAPIPRPQRNLSDVESTFALPPDEDEEEQPSD